MPVGKPFKISRFFLFMPFPLTEYSHLSLSAQPFFPSRAFPPTYPSRDKTRHFEGIAHPARESLPSLVSGPFRAGSDKPRHQARSILRTTTPPSLLSFFSFCPHLSSQFVRARFISERIPFDPIRGGDVCRKPTTGLSGGSLSTRRSADPISKRVRAPRVCKTADVPL